MFLKEQTVRAVRSLSLTHYRLGYVCVWGSLMVCGESMHSAKCLCVMLRANTSVRWYNDTQGLVTRNIFGLYLLVIYTLRSLSWLPKCLQSLHSVEVPYGVTAHTLGSWPNPLACSRHVCCNYFPNCLGYLVA